MRVHRLGAGVAVAQVCEVGLPHPDRPPVQHAGDWTGGDRFVDSWRLGLPLSIMAIRAGGASIAVFGPLTR